MEGTGPSVLGRVLDVELDDHGFVYVLAGMNAQVRVFGPDGGYRFSMGAGERRRASSSPDR